MNQNYHRYDDHDDNCQVIIAIMALMDCESKKKVLFLFDRLNLII